MLSGYREPDSIFHFRCVLISYLEVDQPFIIVAVALGSSPLASAGNVNTVLHGMRRGIKVRSVAKSLEPGQRAARLYAARISPRGEKEPGANGEASGATGATLDTRWRTS